jgi:hypothetical protein
MDPSFIPVEVVPSKTPFGLDQLRRSYKTALSAEDAIAAVPNVGDADEVFPFMFLMPIATPESAESATRIDLVYMGCIRDDGDGNPILPVAKHDSATAVQSASSSRADDGRTADPAITVQFYAPTVKLTYFSFGAPGTDTAADPAEDLQVITVTLADQALSVGSGTVNGLIEAFFDVQTLETHESSEIVPGQYWQNTSQKVKSYTPFIFNLDPGAYLSLSAPGTSYAISDILTVAAGGESASVTVVQVGISNSITAFSVGSNTFTMAHANISASGGSGTGAKFNVNIVT